jgi:prepilin-type N-terminal cleavage/methylation domain-containing protein
MNMAEICMNNKGFTLVESIIVITILGVISLVSLQFFTKTIDTYSILKEQKVVYDEAALALERMEREIRDAKSIPLTSGNKIRIWKAYTTPLDSNLYVTFALNGTNLQRGSSATDSEPASYYTLVSNCTTFTVTNTSNEIFLSLTLSVPGKSSVTLQSKVYPKNLPFSGTSYSGRNFAGDWEEEVQ